MRENPSSYFRTERTKEMLSEIAELASINSFTDHREGVNATIQRLTGVTLQMGGLAREELASARFGRHLIFRTRQDLSNAVLLVGHTDTVFPPGTFDQVRVDGDLLRGPGVLDMKGGIVVVATALRAISETIGFDGLAPIALVLVSDEEVGSPEGQGVLSRVCKELPRSALVFEAGRAGDAIVTSRKGTGSVSVFAKGVAAHSGNAHDKGRNAIWALARWIDEVQRLTDYSVGSTVNVGKVSGGIGKNTVPDSAEAHVDLRYVTADEHRRLVEQCTKIASKVMRELEGTTLQVVEGPFREPMVADDRSRHLLHTYGTYAAAAGLGSSEAPPSGGGSDGNTTSSLGIPTIDGLGPRGKGFHTLDEQIEIRSLVPKALALAQFLASQTR